MNTFINASVVGRMALAHLYENTVMLPLVNRDWENDFVTGVGDTITIRTPAVLTASDYNGSTISAQTITETSQTLVMDKHKDVSVRVTSKELALNIVDFSSQVVAPAMEAISQAVDADLLALRSSVSQAVGQTPFTHWNDIKTLIDARTTLSRSPNNVPLEGRVVVVGPEMAGEWLKNDLVNRADASGDTVALQTASLGTRKFGFTPYESQNVTDNEGVAFHPSAFTFASRPLPVPQGTVDAAITNYKGLGLRTVFGYDMNLKSIIMSIDIIYGCKATAANRAVIIDGVPS